MALTGKEISQMHAQYIAQSWSKPAVLLDQSKAVKESICMITTEIRSQICPSVGLRKPGPQPARNRRRYQSSGRQTVLRSSLLCY